MRRSSLSSLKAASPSFLASASSRARLFASALALRSASLRASSARRGGLLGSLALVGRRLAGGLLQLLLAPLRLGYALRVGACGGLGGGFLAGYLGLPLALGFLGGLALGLGYGALARLFHLDGHEAVNLGVEGGVALLLLRYHRLDGLLLAFQRGHHLLLLLLLALKGAPLLLAPAQQLALLPPGGQQLCLLAAHLLLLGASRPRPAPAGRWHTRG